MRFGKVLTPLGVETLGRRGGVAENLSARMRAAATSRSTSRGGRAATIGGTLREKIDAILYRHAALLCHQAELGIQGAAPYRNCPSSATEVIDRIARGLSRDASDGDPLLFACARVGATRTLIMGDLAVGHVQRQRLRRQRAVRCGVRMQCWGYATGLRGS